MSDKPDRLDASGGMCDGRLMVVLPDVVAVVRQLAAVERNDGSMSLSDSSTAT